MKAMKNGYAKVHAAPRTRPAQQPLVVKGFRFSPLIEHSNAQRIAVESLLDSMVCEEVITAFRNRSGADMLPLINVIVHLLCTHFANEQTAPSQRGSPSISAPHSAGNQKQEMDEDVKEEKEEKENCKEESHEMKLKKLVGFVASSVEYHIDVLNEGDPKGWNDKRASIEMFIVLLDALLVMISHQQFVQEKIASFKKSANTTSRPQPSCQNKANPVTSNSNTSTHPHSNTLNQLIRIAGDSSPGSALARDIAMRDYDGDEDAVAMDSIHAGFGGLMLTANRDGFGRNDVNEEEMHTIDMSTILDILPEDTREPLEAAMAAASNPSERLEV